MSITTSREERARAIARIERLAGPELERDLVHWVLASQASAVRYRELVEQQGALRDLHAEEEDWIHLLSAEIAARRKPTRPSS